VILIVVSTSIYIIYESDVEELHLALLLIHSHYISYGDTVKEIVKQLLTDNLSLAFAMCYKRTLSIYESELF